MDKRKYITLILKCVSYIFITNYTVSAFSSAWNLGDGKIKIMIDHCYSSNLDYLHIQSQEYQNLTENIDLLYQLKDEAISDMHYKFQEHIASNQYNNIEKFINEDISNLESRYKGHIAKIVKERNKLFNFYPVASFGYNIEYGLKDYLDLLLTHRIDKIQNFNYTNLSFNTFEFGCRIGVKKAYSYSIALLPLLIVTPYFNKYNASIAMAHGFSRTNFAKQSVIKKFFSNTEYRLGLSKRFSFTVLNTNGLVFKNSIFLTYHSLFLPYSEQNYRTFQQFSVGKNFELENSNIDLVFGIFMENERNTKKENRGISLSIWFSL